MVKKENSGTWDFYVALMCKRIHIQNRRNTHWENEHEHSMQLFSGEIYKAEVQHNRLCFKPGLAQHGSKLIEKKRNFRQFFPSKCKELTQLSVKFITCWKTIVLHIMLESSRASHEWWQRSSWRNYFTCNYEEQDIPSAPIFRAYSEEMCIRW